MREQRNKNFQLNVRLIRGEAGKGIPAGLFAPADIVAKLGKVTRYALSLGGEGGNLDSGFHRMAFGPAAWTRADLICWHCAVTLSASEGHHSGRPIKASYMAV
jgi:hypothetical protein